MIPTVTIKCTNCDGTGIFPEKTLLGKEVMCKHCDGKGEIRIDKQCPFRRWNNCVGVECMLWDPIGDCVFKRLIK
jgi:DnaJ-class molecular chaperone